MELPSGILPHDKSIEFFGNPGEFGKCYFIQYGVTKRFSQVPLCYIPMLYEEVYADKKAIEGLKRMDIPEKDWVETYNYCNRGALDSTPDIYASGKRTREFVNCGRRGKCPGEGLCCKMEFKGIRFTHRELQCLQLNNKGKDYEQIKSEMGFNSKTAVNSLMMRLRMKLNAKDKSELIVRSKEIGIH